MNIGDELQELDDINHCGFAMLQYAVSLPGNEFNEFINKNGRWVCDPNYVTYQSPNLLISYLGMTFAYSSHLFFRSAFSQLDLVPTSFIKRTNAYLQCMGS